MLNSHQLSAFNHQIITLQAVRQQADESRSTLIIKQFSTSRAVICLSDI
jgi:hypothetical protein